jgi:hypothetical protein
MGISQQTVSASLVNATSSGVISAGTAKMITTQLDDIALAGCGGIAIEDIDSEEVTLVAVIIDASGSMDIVRKQTIDAYNDLFLDNLKKARNADSILISLSTFSTGGDPSKNVHIVHSFLPASQCPNLTLADYQPDGMTPLNDAVFAGLTGLVSYGQQLCDNGTRTKREAVVISDGLENASRISTAKVRQLSGDLLRQHEFVLAYAYIGEPNRDAAENEATGDQMAEQIGFPKRHRLTIGKDGKEVRRLFGTMSASVISTSQAKVSAGSLSSNPFFQLGR